MPIINFYYFLTVIQAINVHLNLTVLSVERLLRSSCEMQLLLRFVIISVKLTSVRKMELKDEASVRFGVNNKGEFLIDTKENFLFFKQDRLTKLVFQGNQYTQVASNTFPHGLGPDCRKVISHSQIFLQYSLYDQATHVLNNHDLSEQTVVDRRGLLIDCLPPDDLVYQMDVLLPEYGYILVTGESGIKLQPPEGAWVFTGKLSICCSSEKIFVTEHHTHTLDVFNRSGVLHCDMISLSITCA